MTAGRAQTATSTTFAALSRRQVVELTLPGVAIGVLAGVIAGGLVVMGGEAFHVALFACVVLGLPLAIAGAGYEILLAQGRFPLGMLTPVVLYWAVAFTVCRVVETALLDLYAGSEVAVPHGWLDFVVYQALVSVGFGIGYWWLHENFAPRWWYAIRERNPVADDMVRVKLDYAVAAEREKARKRKQRDARRAKQGRR
jgi:hypothetical protein